MAISIHTNYAALLTQTNMAKSNAALGVSQQRLGTGYRVNSAADDAAGLQIATRLNAQARGQSVAQRNAQDGISMLQTAEGALNEFTNIVLRMKDLATQAANGTNSTKDVEALDAEFRALGAELHNIVQNTSYGANNPLFSGVASGAASGTAAKLGSTLTLQIGSSAEEKLEVKLGTVIKKILEDGVVVSGGTAAAGASGASGTITPQLTSGSASGLITSLNTLLDNVGKARGEMGAYINRLNHTINNLANMSDNTNTAMGRILDTDFAAESTKMTKQNMLMQSSVAMLKQTSQMGGLALSLLG